MHMSFVSVLDSRLPHLGDQLLAAGDRQQVPCKLWLNHLQLLMLHQGQSVLGAQVAAKLDCLMQQNGLQGSKVDVRLFPDLPTRGNGR